MVWKEYDKKEFMFSMTDGADDVIKVYQRSSDKLFIFVIRLPYTTNKLNNFKKNNNPSWLVGINYPSQMSEPTLLGEYSTRKEAYDKIEKYMKQHQ